MLVNYSYHIWFKVCKLTRLKYKLSTNMLLVLHGVYLYYTIINKPFTKFKLQNFITYYNHIKIKWYIDQLVSRDFITLAGEYKTHPLYQISATGLQVIIELNESYNKELYLFCNKYNIEL